MGSNNFIERRRHERARVQSIVVGILNSDEIVATGLINDISLGGVNFTHELGMAPDATFVNSIDLIAENNYLNDIPCEFAWHLKVEKEPYLSSRKQRRCGIQFVELSPDQIFLLRRIINRCTSLGIKNITSTVHLTFK